jgi:hypothetical protein
VADGVDAAVHPQQPPGLDPPVYGALVEPHASKLGGGDDPMLVGGDSRECQIRGCGQLFSDTERFCPMKCVWSG